jgi:hypothetical protein
MLECRRQVHGEPTKENGMPTFVVRERVTCLLTRVVSAKSVLAAFLGRSIWPGTAEFVSCEAVAATYSRDEFQVPISKSGDGRYQRKTLHMSLLSEKLPTLRCESFTYEKM